MLRFAATIILAAALLWPAFGERAKEASASAKVTLIIKRPRRRKRPPRHPRPPHSRPPEPIGTWCEVGFAHSFSKAALGASGKSDTRIVLPIAGTSGEIKIWVAGEGIANISGQNADGVPMVTITGK